MKNERDQLKLAFGNVQAKRIITPNDFISHMVEHIAWRMGCAIDLSWPGTDWQALGHRLGARIRAFPPVAPEAATLGMMDDGSAEILISPDASGTLDIRSGAQVDREWFLAMRCEQLSSGRGLVDLLTGLARGLEMKIEIMIVSFEDPHHTWEAVFRGIGVALYRMFSPPPPPVEFNDAVETDIQNGDITIASGSGHKAEIIRHTAESQLSVNVDFSRQSPPVFFQYKGAPIAQYRDTDALDGFHELLALLAGQAGISLKIVFRSKILSSSHVLLEDTGMVIGRALREILTQRMMGQGINGAGSSIQCPEDLKQQPISVGVSVEGRKFTRFVPFAATTSEIRRQLIIGRTVLGGLFSEDLDDFIDGLSWGLGGSIMVHIKERVPADTAWRLIFENLGRALKEVFTANPYRKGVPPGVRANLN